MKLGLVLSSNDPETVYNAFRLGNFARSQGDTVNVFLLGRGVELESLPGDRFDVAAQARDLVNAGGVIQACGTCLKIRSTPGTELCPLSTMRDLWTLVRDCDRVLSF